MQGSASANQPPKPNQLTNRIEGSTSSDDTTALRLLCTHAIHTVIRIHKKTTCARENTVQSYPHPPKKCFAPKSLHTNSSPHMIRTPTHSQNTINKQNPSKHTIAQRISQSRHEPWPQRDGMFLAEVSPHATWTNQPHDEPNNRIIQQNTRNTGALEVYSGK
jgi:hypothetical protein